MLLFDNLIINYSVFEKMFFQLEEIVLENMNVQFEVRLQF